MLRDRQQIVQEVIGVIGFKAMGFAICRSVPLTSINLPNASDVRCQSLPLSSAVSTNVSVGLLPICA